MFFTSFLRKKKREKKSFLSHSKSTTFHKALSIIFFPYYNLLFIFFLLRRRRRSPRAKIVLLIFFPFFLSVSWYHKQFSVSKSQSRSFLSRDLCKWAFLSYFRPLSISSAKQIWRISRNFFWIYEFSLSWPDFFMQIQSTTNWRWKRIKQTHFIYS